MEHNPLRGLFGVSSPRPVEQRVAPQPTEPTENVYFEIFSGMIEKLLANPFTGDGTLHPLFLPVVHAGTSVLVEKHVSPTCELRQYREGNRIIFCYA